MSLFVRKDLPALLAEAGSGTLRRELGPVALVTLGIGAVIGAGIRLFIWLAIGLAIYFVYGRSRAAAVRSQPMKDAA